MTPAEAIAAIDDISGRTDPLTDQLTDNLADSLNIPALPVLMRCKAMALVTCGAAAGVVGLIQEDGAEVLGAVHMVEVLPDIVILLRAAADLFEAANLSRTH